jgi:hypothetical protein
MTFATLAGRTGLAVWNKPASACLSSRIEYGRPITREALRHSGFEQARVRQHGEIVRIEIARHDLHRALMPDLIITALHTSSICTNRAMTLRSYVCVTSAIEPKSPRNFREGRRKCALQKGCTPNECESIESGSCRDRALSATSGCCLELGH